MTQAGQWPDMSAQSLKECVQHRRKASVDTDAFDGTLTAQSTLLFRYFLSPRTTAETEVDRKNSNEHTKGFFGVPFMRLFHNPKQ